MRIFEFLGEKLFGLGPTILPQPFPQGTGSSGIGFGPGPDVGYGSSPGHVGMPEPDYYKTPEKYEKKYPARPKRFEKPRHVYRSGSKTRTKIESESERTAREREQYSKEKLRKCHKIW